MKRASQITLIRILKRNLYGQHLNIFMDRNLYNRLAVYSDEMGQTKTLAIERILKKALDEAGIPAIVEDPMNEN